MRWTEPRKESLRRAVSRATEKHMQAKQLAKLSGVPAGSIRQFVSAGTLGDGRCDLVARALEERGLWTNDVPETPEQQTVQAILDDLDLLRALTRMDHIPLVQRMRPAFTVAERLFGVVAGIVSTTAHEIDTTKGPA